MAATTHETIVASRMQKAFPAQAVKRETVSGKSRGHGGDGGGQGEVPGGGMDQPTGNERAGAGRWDFGGGGVVPEAQ